jgi:hypothetical protein
VNGSSIPLIAYYAQTEDMIKEVDGKTAHQQNQATARLYDRLGSTRKKQHPFCDILTSTRLFWPS